MTPSLYFRVIAVAVFSLFTHCGFADNITIIYGNPGAALQTFYTNLGHTVTYVAQGSATTANISNADLIISYWPNANYSAAMKTAIAAEVNAGANLLLFANGGNLGNTQNNDLLTSMGAGVSFETAGGYHAGCQSIPVTVTPSTWTTNFTATAITTGFITGVNGTFTSLVTTSLTEYFTQTSYGNGNLFMLTDVSNVDGACGVIPSYLENLLSEALELGCTLPTLATPFVTTVNDRQHTLTNVNIAGSSSNTSFVGPGESVTLSFTYNIVAGGGASCPGCVTQMYIGIKDEWGTCVTSYGGFCNCTNNYSTSFTAPTTPGVYYFTLGASWLFNCGAPNPNLPFPNGSNEFAAIIVREEWTTAITNESCVGDNDGQVALTSVYNTPGQSFNWNTGGTTSTISSLTAGTYTVTASDSYGCSFIDTVTVLTDTTSPQIFAESNLAVSLDGTGNASISAGAIDSASSDDCPLTLEIGQFSLNGLENDYRFLGNYNGHAYFLSRNISNFTTAQTNATAAGGYLATINDIAENNTLQGWIEGSFPYIGLNDIALEGTFVWDNSEPTGFFNWSGSEPNNTGGNEDCVQFYYTTGLWNDIPCFNQYLSIVEFDIPVPFSNNIAFTCTDTGDQVVVLRGTDQGGLVGYDTTIVSISDNSPPALATQSITISLDSNGLASIATDTLITGGSDNCQLDTTYLSQYDFSCANVGTNLVTVFAEDVSGNQSSVNVTVTVQDTLGPITLTNDLTVYLDATGNTSISTAQINNNSWDSCGIDTLFLDVYDFTCADTGINIVTLNATDVNGNTSTNTATVTVLDTIDPTVVAQDDTVYLDVNGTFTLTPGSIDAGSFDNCLLTLSIDTANFNCTNVGTPLTVTLTGTDPSGNSGVATASVIVLDTISPTVNTQNITVHLDAQGDASIVAGDVNNGTWDSCGIASLSLDVSNFTCANTGVNNVTLTATDVNGNASTGIAIVNVLDTFSPNALGQNLTLYLDTSGNVSTTANAVNNGSYDSCGIASLTLSDTSFDCADVGAPVPIVLTVVDVNGNTDTAQVNITILDTISPNVSVNNSIVYLDSSGNATITPALVDAGTNDNCAIASLSIDTNQFSCSGHGDTIITTFTALDVNGNSSSTMVELYILDTIAPEVITQNITLYLNSSGQASIDSSMIDNGSWDSCGIASMVLDTSHFTCANTGINAVTLTITDVHGNSNSAVANVDVQDTIAPHIELNNIIVQLDSFGQATITPALADNGTWDSCGIASLTVDSSNFSCSNVGVPLMVVFTATDVNGNVSLDSFQVDVEDNIAPSILTQNITVTLDSTGNATINPSLVNIGTWDSCGIDSLWLSETTFDCADIGVNAIEFFAQDLHSNLDSQVVQVTIIDTQAAVVNAQDLSLYLDTSGSASTNAIAVDNGSIDNCGISAMWLSDSIFDCADTITPQIITLYVEDLSGNLDSANVNISLLDTLIPVMATQNINLYLDSTGFASIETIDIDAGTMDNCALDSLWLDQYDFGCSQAATIVTVELFARDVSGNIDSATAQVSVFDTIAPQVIVQNITVYLDSHGLVSILPLDVDSGTWDSCGIAALSLSDSSFNCGDVGVNTVTFFAEDIHGNMDSTNVNVTVEDTIAPTIIIQDLMIFLDSNGLASITADSVDVGTWDSCGIASISIDTSFFNCQNHGDTLSVLFSATDIHNNVSVDTSTFIILDTLPPVLFVHNDTFYLDSAGLFLAHPVMLDDSTTDNCEVDSLYLSDSLFSCLVVDSTFEITFYALDIHQNIDSTQVSLTFLDTIHPIITCNDSIIVPNDSGVCGAIVGFDFPSAWDNCSVDSIIQIDVTGLDSGSFFPVGFTQLSYVAYDQSGNTDSCSFIIEVQDVASPQLFCAPDTQICDTTYIFDIPQYTDNCTGFSVVQIAGIESGEFYPVGTTINTFVVTDSYGNSDTCSTEVLRYDFPSEANAGADAEQCEVFSITMAGNEPAVGIGIWTLTEGTGEISDTLNASAVITGLSPGANSFEWRIENGVCPIERDTMTVIEYLNPNFINAGEDQILCDTSLAMLSPVVDTIGIGSWLIPNNGAVIADTTAANGMISELELGSYTFTWKVVNGVCEVLFDDIQVEVVPYPVLTVADDSSHIFKTSPVTLTVSSTLPVTYTWSPAFTVTNVDDSIVVVDPEVTTEYVVRGVTEFGCAGADRLTVFVNESLEIPTAFTPDGDGWNDVWNIKELENYPNCTVKIYNRWGHSIFESAGYKNPWDGTFNGDDLPSGSYFYVIELGPGSLNPLTGSITIIKG